MHQLNTLRRSLIPPTFYFLASIFITRNSTYMVIIGHCRVISKNPPPTTPCHTCLISPCDNLTQFLLSSLSFFPPYPSGNEPNTVKLFRRVESRVVLEPHARTNHRELSLMPLSTARMTRTPREERHSRRRGSFALSAGGGSASSRVAEETAVPGGGLHHRAIATSANLAMSSVCFSFFSRSDRPAGEGRTSAVIIIIIIFATCPCYGIISKRGK